MSDWGIQPYKTTSLTASYGLKEFEQPDFTEVQKEEFLAFIAKLPERIRGHIIRICEPAQMWYSDGGEKLAYIILMDGSDYYQGQTNKYFVLSSRR